MSSLTSAASSFFVDDEIRVALGNPRAADGLAFESRGLNKLRGEMAFGIFKYRTAVARGQGLCAGAVLNNGIDFFLDGLTLDAFKTSVVPITQ